MSTTPAPSRPISARRLAASRANAKKSTGRRAQTNTRRCEDSCAPRTPEGKARSRWNALKHGIFAKDIIPPSLERYESPVEFARLLGALQDEYMPAGVVEGALVEGLAACYWRLARLHRAEGAAVAQANEGAGTENEKRAHLLADVRADRAAIEQALASGDIERLQRVLDPQGLYPSCQGRGALAMAADQLRRIRDDLSEEEIKDPQTACDRAAMPDMREAVLFARYEAHIHREIHRDLSNLHRLQRERRRDNRLAPGTAAGAVGRLSRPATPTNGQPTPLSRTHEPSHRPPPPRSQACGAHACAPSPSNGQPTPPGAARTRACSPRSGGIAGGHPEVQNAANYESVKRSQSPTTNGQPTPPGQVCANLGTAGKARPKKKATKQKRQGQICKTNPALGLRLTSPCPRGTAP